MSSYFLTLIALIAASFFVVSLAGQASLMHQKEGDVKKATTAKRLRIGAWVALTLFAMMLITYSLWKLAAFLTS